MEKTIVVGDVHGCLDELQALLDASDFRPSVDRLVFVGDLINKGPDSIGVLRLARALGARAVLGNHDELVLRAAHALDVGADAARFDEDVRALAARLSADDRAWIGALPLTLTLDEHVVVVHAGLVPRLPLDRQPRDLCLTMRSIRPDGTGTKRLEEGEPWASRWPGPDHVLFGHDAVRGLQVWPHATGLDTGCVYGGRLTAMILPERRLVSVPARRVWRAPRARASG